MATARDKGNDMQAREIRRGGRLDDQLASREGQAGPGRKSERFVVPWKPGNSGGGKGPYFQRSVGRKNSREIDDESETSS